MTDSSGTRKFFYDGNDVIQEYNSDWSAVRMEYTHGPWVDEPLSMTDHVSREASDTHYLMKDRLGSIINILDENETVKTTYSYDAFGDPTATYHSGQVDCMYRFTGRVYDGAMGNYFYRARYYNQSLGRFFSRDLILGVTSLYVYCGNSPMNFTDPLGLAARQAELAADADASDGDNDSDGDGIQDDDDDDSDDDDDDDSDDDSDGDDDEITIEMVNDFDENGNEIVKIFVNGEHVGTISGTGAGIHVDYYSNGQRTYGKDFDLDNPMTWVYIELGLIGIGLGVSIGLAVAGASTTVCVWAAVAIAGVGLVAAAIHYMDWPQGGQVPYYDPKLQLDQYTPVYP